MAVVIFLLTLLALLPASIAQSKGKNFWQWYLYGFFLLPIALIHSGYLPSSYKKCPQCAEAVHLDAKICIHCGIEFEELSLEQQEEINSEKAKDKKEDMKLFFMLILLLLAVYLAGLIYTYFFHLEFPLPIDVNLFK